MLSAFIPVWAALSVGFILLLTAIMITKREKKSKVKVSV
jgi:hypothetical protein